LVQLTPPISLAPPFKSTEGPVGETGKNPTSLSQLRCLKFYWVLNFLFDFGYNRQRLDLIRQAGFVLQALPAFVIGIHEVDS
jgi:hypothetical protein